MDWIFGLSAFPAECKIKLRWRCKVRNWRTTTAGAVGAAVTYLVSYIQTGQAIDYKAIAIGAAMVVLGYLSKDAGVTGDRK